MFGTHFLVKSIFLWQFVFLAPSILLYTVVSTHEAVIWPQGLADTENVLGVWEYKMTNASQDSPYKDGIIFVTKLDKRYDVAIKFSNGILTGKDVIIENGHIQFNVNISGLERVSFVLFVNGDRIEGKSFSVNGSSQISGMRQHPVR